MHLGVQFLSKSPPQVGWGPVDQILDTPVGMHAVVVGKSSSIAM